MGLQEAAQVDDNFRIVALRERIFMEGTFGKCGQPGLCIISVQLDRIGT